MNELPDPTITSYKVTLKTSLEPNNLYKSFVNIFNDVD